MLFTSHSFGFELTDRSPAELQTFRHTSLLLPFLPILQGLEECHCRSGQGVISVLRVVGDSLQFMEFPHVQNVLTAWQVIES